MRSSWRHAIHTVRVSPGARRRRWSENRRYPPPPACVFDRHEDCGTCQREEPPCRGAVALLARARPPARARHRAPADRLRAPALPHRTRRASLGRRPRADAGVRGDGARRRARRAALRVRSAEPENPRPPPSYQSHPHSHVPPAPLRAQSPHRSPPGHRLAERRRYRDLLRRLGALPSPGPVHLAGSATTRPLYSTCRRVRRGVRPPSHASRRGRPRQPRTHELRRAICPNLRARPRHRAGRAMFARETFIVRVAQDAPGPGMGYGPDQPSTAPRRRARPARERVRPSHGEI